MREVRGLAITPEQAAWAAMHDVEGQMIVPSPLKWPGGKGRPSYVGPLRDAFNRVGRQRRVVEPFLGGANIALNLQPERALLSDSDPHLISAYEHMLSPEGISIDWSQFTDDEGMIEKPTFYDLIRGGLPQGRIGTWPPREGSLNHFMQNMQDLSPEERRRMVQMWLLFQQAAYQGHTRRRDGLFRIGSGTLGPYSPTWDYSHYAPLMRGWDLRNMGIADFMDSDLVNPEQDFLVLDPPYLKQGANYTPDGFDRLQQPMAEWAGGLAQQGLPIVAFNSQFARPLYDKERFNTILHSRMDTSGGRGGQRGVQPEMIAYANIPDMDWFRNHPSAQFIKSQDAFAIGWSMLSH